MAGARAGPGWRNGAPVSVARGGAGARGPLRPRPISARQGLSPAPPSHQSRPDLAAPAPPCPLFPLSLAVPPPPAGAAPAAGLQASNPATSGPRGSGRVPAPVYSVCARARVQGPPLAGTGLRVVLNARVSAAAPGAPEGLTKVPVKLFGEAELWPRSGARSEHGDPGSGPAGAAPFLTGPGFPHPLAILSLLAASDTST